mmetsp:Transcript_1519/g.4654  ORF Transcript_1519/g.4654 Transcript_1519/m.4654 type:complete len:242 (-) Transcript_1519:289-1014(-)
MTSRVGRGVASAARRVALLSAAATATTPRPTPARPDNIVADYFYSHVAKTGGGSFAKMVEKGRLRPLRPCHVPLHTLRCARQRCDVALNGRGAPCVASSEGHLKNVALGAVTQRSGAFKVRSVTRACSCRNSGEYSRRARPSAPARRSRSTRASSSGSPRANRSPTSSRSTRTASSRAPRGNGATRFRTRRYPNLSTFFTRAAASRPRSTAPTTRGTSRRGIWVTATSRGRRASSTKRTGS